MFHAGDPRYYSLRQLLATGNVINYEYIYGSPVNDLYPYDVEALARAEGVQRLLIIATDVAECRPVFFERYDYRPMVDALTASGSMPLVSRVAVVDGMPCLDGSLTMPVGVRKALDDGYGKIVVLLTREAGYRKKPVGAAERALIRLMYRDNPKLVSLLLERDVRYNRLMDEIDGMEADGRLLVIRPSESLGLSRTEKDLRKLLRGYMHGKDEARRALPRLAGYMSGAALAASEPEIA